MKFGTNYIELKHIFQVKRPLKSPIFTLIDHCAMNFKVDCVRSLRSFSSSCLRGKEWRLIESRRIAKAPEYKIGDQKPIYVPRFKKDTPDYKYGESKIFKQSNRGLYGGSFIQHGHNISESKIKTNRTWLPNVINKTLWSETLNKPMKLKLTAKVLKTITKEGGLDNYLIKDKSARIKELGPLGWKLRYKVLKKQHDQTTTKHPQLEIIKSVDKGPVTVYFKESVNGTPLRITVGKRKLLYHLMALELAEAKADGLELTHKDFMFQNQSRPVNEILARLSALNFDMSQISA